MREPAFWYRPPSLISLLLSPLAAVYGAVAGRRLRRKGLDAGIPARQFFGMQLLVVRHAIAADREVWAPRDDNLRPLTDEGKKKMKDLHPALRG